MSTTPAEAEVTYTEDNLKTLKDAAHIRQNPGMYVGNTGPEGLHHLVYEIVYNSVDEALAGYCKNITVVIRPDGSIACIDDGRGIPVGIKAETGKSTLEEALTIAGTSGKFDNAAYRVSAGLHGMGAKAMNALSEWCEAEVRREGKVYQMAFQKGYASSPLKVIGPAAPGVSGTSISFKPDPEIFGELGFDYDKLAGRFQQIAFLNRGLAITITDERDGRSEKFLSNEGIAEYVKYLNKDDKDLHAPIGIHQQIQGITVDVCLQYNGGDEKRELCFTNNAYNPDGGTHLSGFRGGLTRSLTAYGKKNNHFKEGLDVKGEDFREGLTAVISISHPDPSFESQTKVKLTNPDVEGMVSSVVYEQLNEYLEKNPKEAATICKKIALSAEARIAAKKARDALKDRKGLLSGGGLPGKLMDCSTRNRDESELFLVEGDSAGGSAESGRDRHYQAVLPLRGKVLNVEKAQMEKLLANAEIAALISAVGVDIGNTEETAKLRYGKIVILTDADVDGQHIRTLLLTFFFRQMRKLVEEGRIFVARPPLFKVTQKKESRFVQTREEMAVELMDRGMRDTALVLLPYGNRSAEHTLSGEQFQQLLPLLAEVENSVAILERRGHSIASFVKRHDGTFPVFHVRLGVREFFFRTMEEVESFRVEQSSKLGRELVVGEAMPTAAAAAPPAVAEIEERFRFVVDEWHEIKALNKAMARIIEMGFEPADLIPLPRIAGREPPVRFRLQYGESVSDLEHLREVVAKIRAIGEKGLTITRFKGLGEMDPEELWDTTLDPVRRTMMKVTMNDAIQAERMFRMLMGTEVEGRRDFILKHRANVEDIDYGA
jgi:DNA gyrase subunit B